jgi:uncharacterized membrane protein
VTALLAVSTPALAQTRYRVQQLPRFGPGFEWAFVMSNDATAIGVASGPLAYHLVRWEGADVASLATGGGQPPYFYWPSAVNASGLIVGSMEMDQGRRVAFRYTPSAGVTPVFPPPLPGRESAALDVNTAGTISGMLNGHAVVSTPDGTVTPIAFAGAPAADDSGFANAVNSGGVVVGGTLGPPDGSTAGSNLRAFRWAMDAGIADLGDFGIPHSASEAIDINDADQIVGVITLGDPEPVRRQEAAMWWFGQVVALADLNDDINSSVVAINELGHVLGYDGGVFMGGGWFNLQSWIWIEGERFFLTDIVQDMPAGFQIERVHDLNDAGQITATLVRLEGLRPQEWLNVILEPVISPACPADLDDGSDTGTPDGGVTIDDLVYYLARFASGATEADLDDDGNDPANPDGGVTIDDLLFFLSHFEGGC